MQRQAFLLMTSVVMMAAFAACANDTTAPPAGGGDFTANVQGSVAATFAGPASSSETGAGWGAQFASPSGESIIILERLDRGRPEAGTYDIVADDGLSSILQIGGPLAGDHTAVASIDGTPGFFSLSGTLTIDTSSPDEVTGRLSFTARDLSEPPLIITAEVEFTTRNQDR